MEEMKEWKNVKMKEWKNERKLSIFFWNAVCLSVFLQQIKILPLLSDKLLSTAIYIDEFDYPLRCFRQLVHLNVGCEICG